MEEFIYKIEKTLKDEYIELEIFKIINNNSKITKNTEIKHILYELILKKEDFEKLNIKSDKIILSERDFRDKNNEKLLKIEINSQELYKYLLNSIKEKGIKTYETDLLEEHKYLIDNNIEISNTKDLSKIKLKTLSIDIETLGDLNNLNIISISTYNKENPQINKVYVNLGLKNNKNDNHLLKNTKKNEYLIEYLESEKELLEKFKQDIINFEPEIIFGWNVIDFDFKVIRDRMKENGVEFNFSKYEDKECKLRINTDFFKDSSMNCYGLLVFDAIQLLKTNYISFEDYKLNTVAKEVLGEEKIDLNDNDDESEENIDEKLKLISNLYQKNLNKLIEYNFIDSKLTYEIVEKLNLINLMIERSIITGTPLTKVKSPIACLDTMYLKELHKRNLIAESNFNFSDSNQIEGAYVMEPIKNFYEDIFVFDFKSLYPSIIMTFNIDPFTYNKNGEIEAPNGAKYIKEKGILPELILRLYEKRDIAKKEKDKNKTYALKIIMNSFYGAVASPKSRFHNRDVGGSITAFGRFIIQMAKDYIEEMGHKVIYGDTDSIFIKFNKNLDTFEEKLEYGKEIQVKINAYFANWIMNTYKQENYLKIEFEKIYKDFFIASKKRYVGYDEISKKTQFVGLEAIRGDWTELGKNFQIMLVEKIFSNKKKEEIELFIKDYIKNLNEGKYDDLLIYKKKITKPLSEYTKTTPPHVRAARELENFNSRTVKYVITLEGPKHIFLINENTKYDYEHYIEKQLKGVSDDLLEIFGIDFDKITKTKNQKSLDRFF